jgi:UDP-N-acetylglucosamine 2-epimerase (non-hydrolysing)
MQRIFKIAVIAGARPNFVKVAPLIRRFSERADEFNAFVVHTGQHYDQAMSGAFFEDLEMRPPAYNLEVGSGSHAVQTAEIMKRFEPVVEQERPDAVVVVGDVNSTVGCALVAKKMNTALIHVEAGLRSFDRSMPEEINRLMTDSVADLLLATEEDGVQNLLREGVAPERVRFVGNLMIDSLFFHLEKARRSDTLARLGVSSASRYGVVTLHRPANVDDPARLAEILGALTEISRQMPLYFSVHPRTRAQLEASHLIPEGDIKMTGPLGYLDFLALMSHSSAVLTDSGGIQEETTALGIPCLTLRDNTERPITITKGTNVLAGTSRESILRAWTASRSAPKPHHAPDLWDGRAAERSVDAIREYLLH